MPPRFDSDGFGFVLTDATRLLRAEMDRMIAAAGLGVSPGDARTLSHVARCGPVRQTLLAGRLGVEAMTVSDSLDRLEAQGHVARRCDPSDRRAKLVEVTPAGADMLERMRPIVQDLHKTAAVGIGTVEWERFIDVLRKVRANLAAAREQTRSESNPA